MIRKIEFCPRMYLGKSIETKKLDKIKKRLCFKPFLAKVYLIVPAGNPADQLDIFDARQLAQPYYARKALYVVGIAADYEEALLLIEQIAGDCLKERGDCKMREYLLCQMSS